MRNLKLFRLCDKDEFYKLEYGILSFDKSEDRRSKIIFNTFDYDEEKDITKTYSKHFFLTKADALKYNELCNVNDRFITVFNIPEELVVDNLGMGFYDKGFHPLEVSISKEDLVKGLKLKSVDGLEDSKYYYIDTDKQLDKRHFESRREFLNGYLYKEYVDSIVKDCSLNDYSSLDRTKKYFDSKSNRQATVCKVKELFYK